MIEDRDFLQVICANPDDDGPRLMYADYLDEKGDPASAARAEFIRVQCALEALAPSDPSFAMLHGRERTLLEEHWRTWLRPACQALGEPLPVAGRTPAKSRLHSAERYGLHWAGNSERGRNEIEQTAYDSPPYFRAGKFRRGFLSRVALGAKPFRGPEYVARLFERTPIDGLTLVSYPLAANREAINAFPSDRLRTLELIDTKLPRLLLGHGAQSLVGLIDLCVTGVSWPTEVVSGVLGFDKRPRLKRLRFHNCRLSIWDFRSIEFIISGLDRLDLIGCESEDVDPVQAFVRFKTRFPNLAHIEYQNVDVAFDGWSCLWDEMGNFRT